MDRLSAATQTLQEEIRARISALEIEVNERLEEIQRLRSVEEVIPTIPLWGTHLEDTMKCCVIVRDDEFGHLSMAQSAVEVLRRAESPMHAKDIWFLVMRGGYPHHSRTSFQALVTCMNRLKSRFVRTSPNTFALADAADPVQSEPVAAGAHNA